MSTKLQEILGTWYDDLAPEFEKDYMRKISNAVYTERTRICPDVPDIFNFLRLTALKDVKVLIIGQDPYVNGEAHGLAFSSKLDKIAPSLGLIYKELENTHNIKRLTPRLDDWAMNGVMLLNTHLTAESKKSGSHMNWGWDKLTGLIIRLIVRRSIHPVTVMLWGKQAQTFFYKEEPGWHMHPNIKVLEAHHPAAQLRSGGKYSFIGCGHFLLADEFHKEHGATPVNW